MASPMAEDPRSPGSDEGTAEDLLDRLMQCDEQLADLLSMASSAVDSLAPPLDGAAPSFEERIQPWLATLNGEVGVAGPSHTLTSATPYSLSTLQLREHAWRQVAQALAAAPGAAAPRLGATVPRPTREP